MTYFIWISGGDVAALIDELEHVLYGGSESSASKFHGAIAQNASRTKRVLQQLHYNKMQNTVKTLFFFNVILVVRSDLFHGCEKAVKLGFVLMQTEGWQPKVYLIVLN